MWTRLQYGEHYWDGEKWTREISDFKLFYSKLNEDYNFSNIYYKGLPIRSTAEWSQGITEDGTVIPAPDDAILSGTFHLTIFMPHNIARKNQVDDEYYWLKDFRIKCVTGDPLYSNKDDTDTVYTSDPEDPTNVKDFDDIELKVCTWDNKKPNYSCVVSKQNDTQRYVNGMWSDATKKTMRQEEHLVERFVRQYRNPCVRLKLCLKNELKPYSVITDPLMGNRVFVPDVQEIDIAAMVTRVEIREIKTN